MMVSIFGMFKNYDIVLVDISVSFFDNYRLLPFDRRKPLCSQNGFLLIFTKSDHSAHDAQKTKQLILKNVNESTPVYKKVL